MSKLELFFTTLFIIGTIVVMILVYFYNIRHKLVIEDELDDYEVEKKPGEKAIAPADKNFDWELYESDLMHDYDKFVGYDIWKSKKTADERIDKLQKDFESGSNILKINMIESMMLVDIFSNEISLRDDGTYKISLPLLSEFLKNLEYNVSLVEKIEELKEEMDFSIETYEIDARKIFYIMRNASRLGLNNFSNHSQVFMFAKNNKNITIDAEVISDTKSGIGEIELYIENFEKNDFEDNSENIKKDIVMAGIRSINKQANIYFDEDGRRVIEYPTGEKIIKDSLWNIEVIEEDDRTNRVNNKKSLDEDKREKFSDIINESNVDEIMSDKDNSMTEREDVIKKSKQRTIEVIEDKIQILNEKILNGKFYTEDKKRVSIIEYLGEVSTVEEYVEKLKSLSDTNKKVMIILLLSIDAAKVNSDEKEINLIVEIDGSLYISYDWICFLFISLLKNRSEFLVKNQIMAKSFTLNFRASFAEKIISVFHNSDHDIINENSGRTHLYFKNRSDEKLSMSLFELSKNAEHLLSTYNSDEKIQLTRCTKIDKNDFKDSGDEKHNITFRNMFSA